MNYNRLSMMTVFNHAEDPVASENILKTIGMEGNLVFTRKNDSTRACYSWFVPGDAKGTWSYLKTIDSSNSHPKCLWARDSETRFDILKDIRDLCLHRASLYYVPMSQVVYSCTPGDDNNFELYVVNSSKSLQDNSSEFVSFSHITYDPSGELHEVPINVVDYHNLRLYNITNNEEVSLNPWSPSHLDSGWDTVDMDEDNAYGLMNNEYVTRNYSNYGYMNNDEDMKSPVTPQKPPPPNTPPPHNVSQTQDDAHTDTHSDISYDSDDESGYDSDNSEPRIVEGEHVESPMDEQESDSDLDLELDSESESEYGEESEESDDCDDSDEEEEMERYRMDDSDGMWYTKEEFYEYYGSDTIWEAMHPHNRMVRQSIYGIYNYFGHLSVTKLTILVSEIKDTYNVS